MPDKHQLLHYLPDHEPAIARLAFLEQAQPAPVVGVFGKYNHGKSSLLNTLINKPAFKVADHRETRTINRHKAKGICWMDTPGLDADIAGKDDTLAREAIFQAMDIVLLVHSAAAGELDRSEQREYRALQQQMPGKLLLVLSCIDETDDASHIQAIIRDQLDDTALPIYAVSAKRYNTGVQKHRQTLLEKSGIPALAEQIQHMAAAADQARQAEKQQLQAQLLSALQEKKSAHSKAVNRLKKAQQQREKKFLQDLAMLCLARH